jgi:hypothetical protein
LYTGDLPTVVLFLDFGCADTPADISSSMDKRTVKVFNMTEF